MLDKKYNHQETEKGIYDWWLKNGYFESGKNGGKPFTIVIPPPNVTGKLHLGHAWDVAIQDALIRFKRMQGFDTLWLPGMDHAAIATEVKVVEKLKKQGISKRDLGRDGFLEKAWEWKEEYAANIREQWAKLGLSLDYRKERFTLDEGMEKAVKEVFIKLYNEGLIYRGERIINWDPESKTALSTEEVVYKDVKGAFYHIKYPLVDSDKYLDVATTRPETMFGDVAVAVNPKDERYQDLIGKMVHLPFTDRDIPIIADIHADPEKGTGCVKITPAHDPNDFEVGNRHNLEKIVVINPDGTLNEKTPFNGVDRFEAREKLVAMLKEEGYLLEIEPIVHSVGHSERTGVMIEPYLSKQWFVKMRPLADKVLENQKNKATKVNFVPARYEKIMNHWMEITYDWCISRQLWWGHRIPVWYKGDEVYVGVDAPKEEGWVQDEDVLDTWFSSALWPFATLGWPDETPDYKKYFPTTVLVTGYDIIPFWVNRMTFQSLHFTGQRPFEYCLIHGLIRDKEGRKFSKSLGNGVDPMDVIDKYGADALRYYLTTSTALGTDIRYDEEKVAATWNFINKVWNASRFVLMNLENDAEDQPLNDVDKWILTRYEETIKNVTKFMERFELQNVGSILYDFIWSDFCDAYIEMAKFNLNSKSTLATLREVLIGILKMLHPFMPYVTENIYREIVGNNESIMTSIYPVYEKTKVYGEEATKIEAIREFVSKIRTLKQEHQMGQDYKINFTNIPEQDLIVKLLKCEKQLSHDFTPNYVVEVKDLKAEIYYEKVATAEDIAKREKELEDLKKSIAKREQLLNNASFVSKAPQALVESEKEKLAAEKKKLEIWQ